MGRRLELGGGGSILNSKAEFDRCRIPRLIVEEQDHDKLDKLEEQEQKEVQELLDEQLEDWGSDKIKERGQKDKENRSNIPKIKEKSKGGKREQDQRGEGSRSKKLRYKREEEDWGETTFPSTDIREQCTPSPSVEEQTNTPTKELQPLEQRRNPRRSRQQSLRELLGPQSGAPKGTPLKPAGSRCTITEDSDSNEQNITVAPAQIHQEEQPELCKADKEHTGGSGNDKEESWSTVIENRGCCSDGEVTPSSSNNVDKPDIDEVGEEENVVFTSNDKEDVVRNVGSKYSGMCEEEQLNVRDEAEVEGDVRNEVISRTEDENVTGMREECY